MSGFFWRYSILDSCYGVENEHMVPYLNDRNLSGNYKIFLTNLETFENELRLKIKHLKCEISFSDDVTEKRRSTFFLHSEGIPWDQKLKERRTSYSQINVRLTGRLIGTEKRWNENVNGSCWKIRYALQNLQLKEFQFTKAYVLSANQHVFKSWNAFGEEVWQNSERGPFPKTQWFPTIMNLKVRLTLPAALGGDVGGLGCQLHHC